MKMVLTACVFLNLLCYTSGWSRGRWEKYGPVHMALNSELIECDRNKSLNLDVSDITVFFYNDFSKSEKVFQFPIYEAANGILSIGDLKKNKEFIIFIGGYKSHINKHAAERMRDTYRHAPNYYLIIIDHSPYTNNRYGFITSYERAVKYVYYIGKAVGVMLAGLRYGGISPKHMHCIGHSLGGQILGVTGETFINMTGEKIRRITALDPAGPCFSKSPISEQVRSGVAEYVEVYHCNSGMLGTSSVLGDIDFFVNKEGQFQPNCGTPLIPGFWDSAKASACSHRTCIQVYTASVNNPGWFPAWMCDNYEMFKMGKCPSNSMITAGFWNPGVAKGVYYFTTKGYLLD